MVVRITKKKKKVHDKNTVHNKMQDTTQPINKTG